LLLLALIVEVTRDVLLNVEKIILVNVLKTDVGTGRFEQEESFPPLSVGREIFFVKPVTFGAKPESDVLGVHGFCAK